MKLQLINEPNQKYSTIEQIFYNRNINNIKEYINLNNSVVSEPELLGEQLLRDAAAALFKVVVENKSAFLIVDCDCDGYTSAAILINYLHKRYPSWVENNLEWWMHDSKQHGLKDCIEEAKKYNLVICPDSASNDFEEHKILHDLNIPVIILDHHLVEDLNPLEYKNAIIINNQLSEYPNKELSGAGVVWQFCRFIDSLDGENKYANDFLDLVALGLTGDMMSLTSLETRFLIFQGFKSKNIHNPFIEYMADKNNFSLNKSDYKSYISGQYLTSMGAAFFIVPLINAITRSGTIEEKKMIFKAMLNHEAFKKIPEIKRNKETGREEYLVLQAVRVATNVKNRQTRAEKAGTETLEKMIKEKNLLDHKVLLFLLKPKTIPAEIRGLCANKMMAKYQRPCIILAEGKEDWSGSGRGYTKTGIDSLKNVLDSCDEINWCMGHDNAHGVSLQKGKEAEFLEDIDFKLKDISTSPIYRVDYYFKDFQDNIGDIILDIASMNDYWGKDIDRAYVGIRFKITDTNFSIMKNNTLKIVLDNGISIIKFKGTEEDINNFTTKGWVEIDGYCKCNCNHWNGVDYPQLILEDYEIIDSCKYIF